MNVTVGILNYQRRDALEKVLDSLRSQAYPDLETIVVDNASGPEITDWIRSSYPWCELVALESNRGTSARNEIFSRAQGEIIVMLDNDVYFDDAGAIEATIAAFHRLPQAGCISFRVYHPQLGTLHGRDWCHSRPWQEGEYQEFETNYVTEGACAFRKKVFDTVEGYWEDLWIGHEGFDLSLRILDAGWEMWYTPDVKVWHLASLETRDSWRPYYYNTRNLILVAMRDYPWLKMPGLLLPRLGVLGFYAVRYGYIGRYFKALFDGFIGMYTYRRMRKPVKFSTLRKVAKLREGLPPWWSRFLRHWRKAEF